jgi:hypothetical protein
MINYDKNEEYIPHTHIHILMHTQKHTHAYTTYTGTHLKTKPAKWLNTIFVSNSDSHSSSATVQVLK